MPAIKQWSANRPFTTNAVCSILLDCHTIVALRQTKLSLVSIYNQNKEVFHNAFKGFKKLVVRVILKLLLQMQKELYLCFK